MSIEPEQRPPSEPGRVAPVPPLVGPPNQSTPPTQPTAPYVTAAPSSWPTVIGTIAIVLGAGGVLMGAYSALAPVIFKSIGRLVPSEATLAAVQAYAPWSVPLYVLSTLAAGLLLAVGVGLVQRRRWSVRAARLWAGVRILIVVALSILTYYMSRDQMTAMAEEQQSPMPAWLAELIPTISVASVVAWGWAFPVFLLIWLSRGRIRAETAAWS